MLQNVHDHRILILDFGSQYAQLIARRVREIGVYCEIYPYDIDPQRIAQFKPHGVILSGGPESVHAAPEVRIPEVVFELNCPVLGICYGMQAMALQLGGAVAPGQAGEFGYSQVTRTDDGGGLLRDIEDHLNQQGQAVLDVWMSHGDHVTAVPAGFQCSASSAHAPVAAMSDEARRYYGVQFHPEVTHTQQGKRMLQRFVNDICGCLNLWSSRNIIEDAIDQVRQKVGSDHVVLGLSGGVDSSVVAALLHKAIETQLTCIFVDTGLLRLGERDQVMQMFAEHMGVRVICVDARTRYFEALKGITDPEQKRKCIGRLFIEIFEEEADKLDAVRWLAQGTIYPDVIESAAASKSAHVIKSHHNVGGLPEKMKLMLLEPLRELFKDEVRRLGVELGLPADMVYRHPFPGPGLGVRVLGEVKEAYVEILQQADHIFIDALRKEHLYDRVSQAFAVFLPVKSVGVMGDGRAYDWVIALRAVETIDFMTAKWADLPSDFLSRVANTIMNEVKGVSRVVYDISGKPPATIEWE